MTWEQAISILERGSKAIEKKNRELEKELSLKYKKKLREFQEDSSELQDKRS